MKPTQPAGDRRQDGMTLVETLVSLVVLVALMVLIGGAAVSITGMQQQSQVRLKAHEASRVLLGKLREELSACTAEKDLETDLFRFEAFVDANGKTAIRLQTLAGTRMAGGELVGLWSSWIEYHVQPDGVVVRRQDGKETVVVRGIESIGLSISPALRFRVTCTVLGTSDIRLRTDSELVSPRN